MEDWLVRVFWSSSLVDRPSDCLYVLNIPISGCMNRRSCYTHIFCIKSLLLVHLLKKNLNKTKPLLSCILQHIQDLNNHPNVPRRWSFPIILEGYFNVMDQLSVNSTGEMIPFGGYYSKCIILPCSGGVVRDLDLTLSHISLLDSLEKSSPP